MLYPDQYKVKTEDPAPYKVEPPKQVSPDVEDNKIIEQALAILAKRMGFHGTKLDNSEDVRNYCCLNLGHLPHEVFSVLFLDAQNRLIAYERMFNGTLTQTSVYPREVVKAALAHNAAAVIFTHNHTSFNLQPSMADDHLTRVLKESLALVDVKVIDHIIVSGRDSLSMAEIGMV